MHGFQRGNIIGPDGYSIFDGNDYSDCEYVKQAMQGNVYVSEPLRSKITGELSIMVAAPLYSEGTHGSSIVGVVYFVPPETFLNNIVSSIQIAPQQPGLYDQQKRRHHRRCHTGYHYNSEY